MNSRFQSSGVEEAELSRRGFSLVTARSLGWVPAARPAIPGSPFGDYGTARFEPGDEGVHHAALGLAETGSRSDQSGGSSQVGEVALDEGAVLGIGDRYSPGE